MKRISLLTLPALLLPIAAMCGEPAATAKSVSMSDAINAAIASNLTTKLAVTQDAALRARITQSASALLPNILGTAAQSRTFKENLNALMGMGGQVGPFNSFDMRVQLTQSILDIAAIQQYKAAKIGLEYSEQAQELAREQVAAAAALSYIDAARARKAVMAAQADHDLASTLLNLAVHQHENGLVTGLDVARAKTRLSDSKVVLLNAKSSERQSAIRLKRVAGWPLNTELTLAEDIAGDAPALSQLSELLPAAELRADVKICQAQMNFYNAMLSAKKGSRLPVISVSANYGLSGNLPDSGSLATSGIGAYLSIPLFAGGRINGEVAEARSNLETAAARLHDVRLKVEEDVRLSYEISEEAQNETALAEETVALAQQELTMSQDRYSQGVGDNIEVVTAQVELAKVRNHYVLAIARNQQARVNLAAAIGRAQSFSLK